MPAGQAEVDVEERTVPTDDGKEVQEEELVAKLPVVNDSM